MLASKRKYGYEDGPAAKMKSLKICSKHRVLRKGKRERDSDSSSSDDIFQSKEAEKKGTTQYHLCRALDNMLLQAGLGGLATWIEEDPPCRILSPTEYRYEAKDLDPFEKHKAEVWQRWCVEDVATKKRRFEVPATTGEPSRPLLASFTDQCGSQMSLLQGLEYGAGLRMWTFCDPFHRPWNDCKLGLMEAGLWADIFERLHCENLPCGPFKSAAWWREMQEVMKQHFKVATRHNELFMALYKGLEAEARAAGAVRSTSDTDAAADEVWKWLREVSKLTRQNRLTKTKTWFEPFVVIANGIKVHTAYLYVLCILCK